MDYDGSIYIRQALSEVVETLIEAAVIVVLVILVFLGSLRVVMIPLVAIPLSLVGVLFLIWLMGFSINLLTLLAMVISIGLVVDDAIVVVENVHRHMAKMASRPLEAALKGARQVALPVVAMTVTLAAVYFPIGLPGRADRGALHRVCVDAGRRGPRLRRDRIDAEPDDVRLSLDQSRPTRRRRQLARRAVQLLCRIAIGACCRPASPSEVQCCSSPRPSW